MELPSKVSISLAPQSMLTIAMGAHLPTRHSNIQALQSVVWALREKMLMTGGQRDFIVAQTPLLTRFQSFIPMEQLSNSMVQPANQIIIQSIILISTT